MTEIKTTSRTVLRRMLRDCDRKLSWWDHLKRPSNKLLLPEFIALDAYRREIRRRLKEHSDANP